MLAQKKRVPFESLISYLLQTNAQPTLTGATATETVRFHDDKTTYTGVYKREGQQVGGGPAITLENLADRSRATFVAAPHLVCSRNVAGASLITVKDFSHLRLRCKITPALMWPAQRPATAGAGSYAEQGYADARPGWEGVGGNIFDRLTDSSQYGHAQAQV